MSHAHILTGSVKMYPELSPSKQRTADQMLDSSAGVHQPQNKQAIVPGQRIEVTRPARNKAHYQLVHIAERSRRKHHGYRKKPKSRSFQQTSKVQASHPRHAFPSDVMLPLGFLIWVYTTALLGSGLFLAHVL